MTQQNGRLSGKGALALAREGASVAPVARRQDRPKDLAKEIGGVGGQAVVTALDPTQSRNRRARRSPVRSQPWALGGLDSLVNSAGIMLLGLVLGADTSDFSRMLHLNVPALIHMTT